MHFRLHSLIFALVACYLGQRAHAELPTFTHDVVYGHKAGMALTYDVITPQKQNGVGILYIVSGGGVSTWFPAENLIRESHPNPNQHELLIDNGYTLFVVRHGSSPQFKTPEAVEDVRRAVRHIRLRAADFHVNPDRIGVFGASAGGHLALMLATTGDDGIESSPDPVERVSNRVQAVAAICPPTYLHEFHASPTRIPTLDFPAEQLDSVAPLQHVTSKCPPTLLLHGDNDQVVPAIHSERIEAAFKEHGVRSKLIIFKDAPHSFVGEDQIRCQNEVLSWFQQIFFAAE